MVRLPATTECSTPCDRAGTDKQLDNRRQVLSELLLEDSPFTGSSDNYGHFAEDSE